MSIEDQLKLIDQVMEDRSIPPRPGPRMERLRQLGLPDNANIRHLTNEWRRRKVAAIYANGQPRW